MVKYSRTACVLKVLVLTVADADILVNATSFQFLSTHMYFPLKLEGTYKTQ